MGLHVITVECHTTTDTAVEETKKFVGRLRGLGVYPTVATVRHCDTDRDVKDTWLTPDRPSPPNHNE